MIWIDFQDYEPSKDWQDRATTATSALIAAKGDTALQKKILEANSDLWAELKADLAGLSNQKCWYCESRELRSDNAVDHFRPKGNVRAVKPPHEGYWWLAFTWKNYRYSCTFCNSRRKSEVTVGGKQDFFPLEEESVRARTNTDTLLRERPSLLDPTVVMDTFLLAFSDDGSVAPATSASADARKHKRAEVSIELYHLMHPRIVEGRKALLAKIRSKIRDADDQLDTYATLQEESAKQAANRLMGEILQALRSNSEYSAAVRYALAGMPSSVSARILLQTHPA